MGRFLRACVLSGLATMAAVTCSAASRAAVVNVAFSGTNASGALALTLEANPNTGVLPSNPPNSVDPIGSYLIKGISGTFSDASLGFSDVAVDHLVPTNHATPEPGNDYAPASFSFFFVEHGVNGGVPSAGLHYDNLFYPGGSPRTAGDYPFSGGSFDIYGLLFTLANGDTVNLWSNGEVPGTGLTYGVAVTDGIDTLDYANDVSLSVVPLPGAAPLFGAALMALGAVGYAMRRRSATA